MKTLVLLFGILFCVMLYGQTTEDSLNKSISEKIQGAWKLTTSDQLTAWVFQKENRGIKLEQGKFKLFEYKLECSNDINKIDIKFLKQPKYTRYGTFIFNKEDLLLSFGPKNSNFLAEKAIKFIRIFDLTLDKWESYLDKEENIPPTPEKANKDGLIADLNNLGAMAQQFYGKPISVGGGEGSFLKWMIPRQMQKTSYGSYEVLSSEKIQVVISGTGIEIGKDKANKIRFKAIITHNEIKIVEEN